MDKYEYKLKLEQLKHLVEEKDYKTAAEIADTINWRKVKSASTLCMVGEIYDRDKQYENSREILLMAYDRATVGRNIIYRLALVSLKMGRVEEAKEYYEEFLEIAPYDNLKYVLRYQIAKIEGASLEQQIGILEEFKSREYTEEWAFELAYLYHRSGNSERCVEVCDELVLWFGDGKYVEKALELKMLYQPLNKDQEEKYRQFKTHQDGALEIHSTEMMESGEIIQDTVRIPDLTAESGRFNTLNLQEELVKGMQQIIEADTKETVSDTMDNIKKIVEEIPYLQVAKEEETVEEEERYGHIETDEEIDGSLETDFQEMLAEDWDGQIRFSIPGGEWWEPQVNGQIKIEDVLADWEKTKRAAEAAMAVAQQRKLESAKARALQEAEELMERLNHIIPKLNAGITPQELLAERYLQSAAENLEEPSQENFGMDDGLLEMPESEMPEMELSAFEGQEPGFEEVQGFEGEIPEMELSGFEGEIPEMEMQGFEEEVPEMELSAFEGQEPGFEEVQGFEGELPGIEEAAWAEYPENELTGYPEEVLVENVEEQQIPVNEFGEIDLEISQDGTPVSAVAEAPKGNIPKVQEEMKTEDLEQTPPKEQVQEEADKEIIQEQEQAPQKIEDDRTDQEEPLKQQETQEVIKPEKKDAEQYLESVFQAARASREAKNQVAGPVVAPEVNHEIQEVTVELEDVSSHLSKEAAMHQQNVVLPEIKIEPEKEINRRLSEEQREIFSYFVPVTGMEQQLCMALEGALHRKGKDNSSASGNILIMGGRGSGKTVLATDFIKAIQKAEGNAQGKVGKITGESLNQKDLSQLLKKVAGGYLIIERAGEMSPETATRLALLMDRDTNGLLFILEDTRKGIEKALSLDVNFAKKFTEQIKIPVFTSDELVEFAKAYADEQECEIDDMGILALYNRISNIQKLDEATTLAEVKEIVDMAISSAERGGLKKLFGGKKFSPEGYLYLREKDFEE